ncbi:MAG: RsmE family RNA methyltransferase [Bdellovibrio sp.]|nr:RsmE family RNA methyltransferase [Bdellovibrio sp.]
MRAVFLRDIKPESIIVGDILDLTDQQFHHLKNVVRIEEGENILGLNGKGLELVLQYRPETQNRKSLPLIIKKCTVHPWIEGPKIAIGVLKKDGMEEVLKLAVEMGIEKITFLNTKYSQRGLSFSAFSDRYFRIMEGALLQSNNLFFPTIEGPLDFDLYLKTLDPNCALFYYSLRDNRSMNKILPNAGSNFSNIITLIGPEGGLSLEEEERVLALPNSLCFRLSMPILRAPHAMSVALGHVIGLYSPFKTSE